MNASMTVDLSDLNIIEGFNPAYAMIVDSEIESGDTVVYCDDNGDLQIGEYVTLYCYEHAENSPWIGDNRVMAYIRKFGNNGTDYADCTTIFKLGSNVQTMFV